MTDPAPEQLEDDQDDEDPEEHTEIRYPTGPHPASDEPEEAPEVIGPPDDPDAPEVEF